MGQMNSKEMNDEDIVADEADCFFDVADNFECTIPKQIFDSTKDITQVPSSPSSVTLNNSVLVSTVAYDNLMTSPLKLPLYL